VWKRTVEGRTLTFHLAGINNQNFLMRDEETGSYWQQISGLAVSGPMAGKQLELVYSDELTFALWRSEEPGGFVIKPIKPYSKDYEEKDWDVRMAKVRTVLDFPSSGLKPRELLLGIQTGGASRAYPVNVVLAEKLVQDRVGTVPVILVVGEDSRSIRAFEARWAPDGALPDFYRNDDLQSNDSAAPDPKTMAAALAKTAGLPIMMDSTTGSGWSFQGCAVSGPKQGTCLKPVAMLKDYWFDWRNYNPKTTVYKK
jgi:Protein of unknown function (DUF3179)